MARSRRDDSAEPGRVQSSALELRPATASDTGDIARIWREGWLDAHLGHVPRDLVEARTADSFAARAAGAIANTIASTIVATRADAIAGFVMIVEDQVDQLYLDRSARGVGVGAALLGEAERRVIASGHAHAWLAVASGNAPARRFYERQGWIDDGPFVHGAPVPDGVIDVDCHRFHSPERER